MRENGWHSVCFGCNWVAENNTRFCNFLFCCESLGENETCSGNETKRCTTMRRATEKINSLPINVHYCTATRHPITLKWRCSQHQITYALTTQRQSERASVKWMEWREWTQNAHTNRFCQKIVNYKIAIFFARDFVANGKLANICPCSHIAEDSYENWKENRKWFRFPYGRTHTQMNKFTRCEMETREYLFARLRHINFILFFALFFFSSLAPFLKICSAVELIVFGVNEISQCQHTFPLHQQYSCAPFHYEYSLFSLFLSLFHTKHILSHSISYSLFEE